MGGRYLNLRLHAHHGAPPQKAPRRSGTIEVNRSDAKMQVSISEELPVTEQRKTWTAGRIPSLHPRTVNIGFHSTSGINNNNRKPMTIQFGTSDLR